ncbi:MAG: DUF6412 domain-containing protein [Salinibacterium sp.]|nr:DUF6412 domain-containing protein [Salinibacterium sp.]
MRQLLPARLVALATTLFLVLAVTQSGETSVVVASIAIAAMSIAITAALVVGNTTRAVGIRAFARRQAMTATPEPSHPDTAGRPRTRAPSQAVAAA